MSFTSTENLSSPEKLIMNGVSAGAAPPSGKAIYEQRKQYGHATANSGEISQYYVEHLITFPVERKDGLLRVEDSIRKLKLLDARGKVWPQETLMQVDEKAVKLFDQNSEEELEHFSLTSIQHVQTELNSDPYQIIALVIRDQDQKNQDIHLFNCPHVSADVISSDIESALADCKDKKGRKIRPETLRRARERVEATVIPPPPMISPPAPPQKDASVKDRIASWGHIQQNPDIELSPRDLSSESPEVALLRVNRDVQILNHSLDDIEDFVSKLQKSAEAMKELSTRRGKKNKNKGKKLAGDGMLTLRSKLPPQDKFIETYRKYKLAFNLLAKLKNQINNPNAVEIIHYLFSPLEMCIRSCGGFDIPRSVESPLLTSDAIDFLSKCTTTHEAEVWGNLGDFWTKSRQEFPKDHYFPPYIPQFRSGWEPPPLLLRSNSDGEDHATELAATIAEQANRVKAEEARRATDSFEKTDLFKHHVEQHVNRNQLMNGGSPGSPISPPHGTKMCRSMFDFVGRNKNELNVVQDEMLEVLRHDKQWWRVRNKHGQEGYVPGSHMVLMSAHKSPASSNSDAASLVSGPATPMPPPPPAPIPPNANPTYATPMKTIPVPPPPPPAIPANPTALLKSTRNINANNNRTAPPQNGPQQNGSAVTGTAKKTDQLQEELRNRVNDQQQGQRRNFKIPKKTNGSNNIKLTDDSTPEDVTRWLQARSFSTMTVQCLGVLNGAQIFTLTKDDLKRVCEEEGSRVYSQLLVQKSMKGDKDNNNELSRIMKQRQQKIESGT